MRDELARVAPAELLVSDQQAETFREIEGALAHDGYAFLPEQAVFTLCEHFKVKSLDGFGCREMRAAVAAAGAIVHYLKHQLRRKIDHLTALRCDVPAAHVMLDLATQANLELVASRGARDMSLLARSIARSRRWAGGSCGAGFCSRCAIWRSWNAGSR